jgi:hypothetical protein
LASRGHGSVWAYILVCFIIAGLGLCDGVAQGALLGDLSYMDPIYVQVISLSPSHRALLDFLVCQNLSVFKHTFLFWRVEHHASMECHVLQVIAYNAL